MTPTLLQAVNEIINWEFTLSLTEINEMNHCHEMGLQGYKRFNRYWSKDRFKHATMLCNFLVEHHHTVPSITVSYSSNGGVATSLLDSLQKMYETSKTHIARLKAASKTAIAEGEDYLMGYLEDMIADQSPELEKYHREILLLQSTGHDKVFIAIHSDTLHEKYKIKEKEYIGC